jgi:ketosteroid isomerase-like protein
LSANLDLVRTIYADWERGDFRSAEWAHPQIEYVTIGGPEPGRALGLKGMSETMGHFLSAWEDFRVHAQDYSELDRDRILVLSRANLRGKASGVQFDEFERSEGQSSAQLFQIRDGKVTRFVFYWDRDRALADLGLEE